MFASFREQELEQDLKPTEEIKPSIVNKQCVVDHFSCDLCDADYGGYTARHLHQRIAEHKKLAIGRHCLDANDKNNLLRENQFTLLRKCWGKFVCLVFEMLHIKNLHSCETFCFIFLIIFSHLTIFKSAIVFKYFWTETHLLI